MRKILLIFASFFCTLSVVAQDMKTVFLSMPDSITPLLTKVNKEDCIDFLASDMKAEVKNRFGNVSEMKKLTDDYVLIQMTSQSTLEMKLLPLNDSVKVVCMVKTVCASACNSEVHFFSSDWKQELSQKALLQIPKAEEFFLTPDSIVPEYMEARKKADMDLMKASLSADNASLSIWYTTPDYLNQEDREKLLPYLRKEPMILQWESGRFK
ncbi:MAG: DUF3256 family protein [Bacteroidaceae bacterium]|nr:DUF3256 family protein [Bacteroidaceae bacterium]